MIPVGMPDTSTPLPPEFFANPQCPPSFSSVLPATEPFETIGGDFPVKDLSAAKEVLDIPNGSPTRLDKGLEVVAEG